MKTTAMQRELDKVRTAMERAEEAIIAKYRDKYVVPYCDKYQMRLRTGMGSWDLTDTRGRSWGDEWEGRPTPKRVRDTLEAEVCSHDYGAGSMMEDYTPKGWARKEEPCEP